MGTNKKVFDVGLYAIGEALEVALQNGQARQSRGQQTELRWTKVDIGVHSQAALKMLQHTDLGTGQWLKRRIIGRIQLLKECRTEMEIHWVTGHMGVKGNKKADETAKEAAERSSTRRCSE